MNAEELPRGTRRPRVARSVVLLLFHCCVHYHTRTLDAGFLGGVVVAGNDDDIVPMLFILYCCRLKKGLKKKKETTKRNEKD